jgi:hypothetical protein
MTKRYIFRPIQEYPIRQGRIGLEGNMPALLSRDTYIKREGAL